MAVYCRQSVNDESFIVTIEPHHSRQSDRALLAAKAKGAADKGWIVEWSGDHSFTATKDRWGGHLCIREFWTD